MTLPCVGVLALSLVVSADRTLPANVRDLMQDKNYPAAITAIDEALKAPNANRPRLLYLRARALSLQGKNDLAAIEFANIATEFKDAPVGRQAKFAEALAKARMGDFRAAEIVYRDLASKILSDERQTEIAALYLEFADVYYKPPKENQAPDYAKALAFYQKALEAGPKPERRAEIELQIARCHRALNQWTEAAAVLANFVKERAKSPLIVEAMFLLGDSRLKLNDPLEARRVFQDLLAEHAKADSKRVPEAAYSIAKTWGMPAPANDEHLEQGVAALEAYLKANPGDVNAGKAALEIAEGYLHRNRTEQGVEALKRFLAEPKWASLKEVADARVMLGRAYAGQKRFDEALAAFNDYLAKHPAHSLWSQVQSEIIQTEDAKANERRLAKDFEQARKLWEQFLLRYPLYQNAPNVMFEFGQMNFEQKKFAEAIADWRRLVSKYPGHEVSSQAQYRVAETLEKELKQPEEALKEYKLVTWGAAQQLAQSRIAWLTSKGMSIATERVFRSNETPAVELVSRNIDAFNVRAWTVDLETYFRKMHLASGLESLDISLIDPDKSFEFKPKNYAEYREQKSAIPLDVGAGPNADGAEKPQVLVVAVSGKTLEATTLVIRSDLEILVKSSRDEVFVFAQNLRTGKPWPKAKLLLSNGKKVFAEAKTGSDGVFKASFEELKEAADVRVFATADGHTASNVVSLQGLGVATGVSARGYIYTDRPGYRAGQLVHVRGVVRDVAGDKYAVPKGRKLKVEIFDPRNRTLESRDVELGAFGAFHTAVSLPPSSPPGAYRVVARDVDNRSYEQTFQVAEYRLEPLRISIDTERVVYYRGEKIEGTITVSYYYGVPAADKEVRYQLQGEDQPMNVGRTDAEGKIKFSFPTRAFRETQTIALAATLPEFNLGASKNFVLSTKGFSVQVKTPRSVYVQGESFETEATVKDAENKPLGRKVKLNVYERTVVERRVGERLVETHELETNPKTGIARQTLTLAKGATYILRAEGIDRFQNVVSGEKHVVMSDDKDAVRLRILAEALSYRVGDAAEVVVHWREEPAIALVTHQGAKVLGYQLVELVKGANRLKIPMTPELAPNFELAVDVMTDARPTDERKKVLRYHHAETPVTVERDLKLKISVARKDGKPGAPAPGDEVVARITATDSRGNPVSAEVSIAAVEQALLDQFGAAPGDNAIGAFFLGGRRQTAVRSGSSVTFAYRPRTTAIAAALLAEKEREEIASIEEEGRAGMEGGAVALGRDNLRRGGAMAGRAGQPRGGFGGGFGGGGMGFGAAGGVNGPAPAAAPAQTAALPESQAAAKSDLRAESRGRKARGDRELAARKLGEAKDEKAKDLALLVDQPDADRGSVDFGYQAFGDNFAVQTPSKDAFKVLAERGENEVNVYYARTGAFRNLNFGRNPNAQAGHAKRELFFDQLAAAAGEAGGLLVPARGPVETAYWNPGVVTDQAGKAEADFTLPERSTAWRILAKGITMETLAGEADDSVVTKKDLFGELKSPLAFTDGDTAEIEAVVSNDVMEEGDVTMTLTTTIGDKTTTDKKTLKAAKGRQTVRFPVTITRPAGQTGGPEIDASFVLRVSAGDRTDLVRRTATVRPYGVAVHNAVGGAADADATAFIDAPSGMEIASPSLQVLIGSSVERSLLDVLFGPPVWTQLESVRRGAGVESTASDLQAALALQQLIGVSRDAGGPQAQSLDSRVRSSVSSLVSAQMEDGGWTWANPKAGSNHYTSARVVWTLALARRAGYPVPQDCIEKAAAMLQSRLAQIPSTDLESTAVVLHGLSTIGRADFGVANRLHRARPSLSNAALAYLALTHVEMDHKQMAAELLELLGQRGFNGNPVERCLPWNSGESELRALVALAEQEVNPNSARTKPLVDWLLAHRVGHRWSPDKATGPATAALAKWNSRSRVGGDKYSLAVFVNDAIVETLEMTGESGSRLLEIPADRLIRGGRQRVQFRLNGRGRFTYQVTYGGFVAADKLKSTDDQFVVERHYEPAPLEFDGKQIPRGFDVVSGSYQHFRNPLTQLPIGARAEVTIGFNRRRWTAEGPEAYPYLVVTEPLPSGTTVDEKSIAGSFERYELTPGAITFYLGAQYAPSGHYYINPLHYTLVGYTPGDCKVGPTLLRDAYRPERLSVAAPASLTVLPMGEKSKDAYRLTPKELFELGKREFDKRMLKEAAEHLTQLFTQWTLQPDVYKETARLLLETHLETGPAAGIVKYFEIIKEKHPDLEIPFAKILKVGAAYHEMGEYERSYLIFRATVEAAFQKESQAAGFLETQGEFERSVAFMQRLIAEFPPEQYVAGAYYALAQRVYAKASEAARDPKLREKRVGKTELLQRSAAMLDAFLTTYPDDPAADQAAFALANSLLDMKAFAQAIEQCEKYARRYAQGDYVDSYWYVIGYSYFALGKPEQALEMCRKVVEAKRKDKATGRQIDAANKWEAIYILGQVYHSLGRAAEAVGQYQKVADRFLDAKQAIEYFLRKAISAPEVVAVKPGEPAKFPLKFRNVPSVDVKAYRIDLLKFGLLRRDLGNITAVNLSGVRPYHEATVALGDGKDYRDRTHDLMLPLKESGAYLVVCRAEDLYTSGLVLVTPLALEIQEENESGRVRATVKNTVEERYVPNVQVRVIGSANPDFVAGATDLRGVFVADGITGSATVIAKLDAGYAFHRGKSWLGSPPTQTNAPPMPAEAQQQGQHAMPAQKPGQMQEDQLLNNLRGLNRTNNDFQQQQLKQFYDKAPKGVEAKSAY